MAKLVIAAKSVFWKPKWFKFNSKRLFKISILSLALLTFY